MAADQDVVGIGGHDRIQCALTGRDLIGFDCDGL
jgi:hypothetical protein